MTIGAYNTSVGWTLRSIRLRKRLSQETIAAGLNIPQSVVSRCENGRLPIDMERFYAWCRVLEQKPHSVLARVDAVRARVDAGD